MAKETSNTVKIWINVIIEFVFCGLLCDGDSREGFSPGPRPSPAFFSFIDSTFFFLEGFPMDIILTYGGTVAATGKPLKMRIKKRVKTEVGLNVRKRSKNLSFVICEWLFVIWHQFETQYSSRGLKTRSLQLDPKKNEKSPITNHK
jgi:hypothetical protein